MSCKKDYVYVAEFVCPRKDESMAAESQLKQAQKNVSIPLILSLETWEESKIGAMYSGFESRL